MLKEDQILPQEELMIRKKKPIPKKSLTIKQKIDFFGVVV